MAVLRTAARLLLALTLLGAPVVAASSFERYTYANDAGSRTYKIYVPT